MTGGGKITVAGVDKSALAAAFDELAARRREAWERAEVRDAHGAPVPFIPEMDPEASRVWFAGRVPAPLCPHYIAKSEADAGFTVCERCAR